MRGEKIRVVLKYYLYSDTTVVLFRLSILVLLGDRFELAATWSPPYKMPVSKIQQSHFQFSRLSLIQRLNDQN